MSLVTSRLRRVTGPPVAWGRRSDPDARPSRAWDEEGRGRDTDRTGDRARRTRSRLDDLLDEPTAPASGGPPTGSWPAASPCT